VKLGFLYAESLRGTFYPLENPALERQMRLSLNVRIKSVAEFLKDRIGTVDGWLTMEGFADDVPVSGTIAFRWLDQYRLPYDLGFRANDGEPYRLRGQRNLNLFALEDSVTTLVSSLYGADGREIMRANVTFDARSDMGKLLRSVRLTYVSGAVA
jgi:hypothetical protein